jgi:non-heme chloroperoxidase
MGASGIWLKTDENPDGTDGKIFEGIKAGIPHDRYTFFKLFLDNLDLYGGTRVSEPAWQASLKVAVARRPMQPTRSPTPC